MLHRRRRGVLGLELGAQEIRAVMLRGSRVVWRERVAFNACDAAAGIDLLFEALRPHRVKSIAVAVNEPWVRVRRLEGLPRAKRALVATIVRENAAAFFVAPSPIRVGDLQWDAGGRVHGAAYDATVIAAVDSALRRRGRVKWIVPSVARMVGDATQLDGEYETAQWVAGARSRPPLGWRRAADPCGAGRRRRIVLAIGGVLAALGAVAAWLAPAIRAQRASVERVAELRAGASMRGQIEDTVSALRRVDERFARATQFAAQRGEVVAVLAQLSEAVPESTAVIAFHADSAQGSFSALAPSIAELVASLDSAPLIIGPRIAGSITREVAAGSRFERASFRFARAPARFPRSSRR